MRLLALKIFLPKPSPCGLYLSGAGRIRAESIGTTVKAAPSEHNSEKLTTLDFQLLASKYLNRAQEILNIKRI